MTPTPTDSEVFETGPAEEALAERLRRIAMDADPVPELVLEAARAAISLRRLDAALAEMVHDSDLDGVTGVRGAADGADGEIRLLSFEAPGVTISAQLSSDATGQHLIGQVAGTDVIAVSVQTPTGHLPTALGEGGVFRLDDVPSGPMRLVLTTATGEVVADWITL